MSTTRDQLFLGPELAGTLMTPEEFDSAADCDELYVYELIQGVLVVSPLPCAEERGPNELLGYLLRSYRETHALGAAFDYTLPAHLVPTNGNRRRADRVIWAGLGRMPNVRQELPAIVVEFVSAGRRNRQRDYEVKSQEYLQAGISEYWIIDRFRRTLTVMRQPAASPIQIVVREGESYESPLLPGFALDPARLFNESDRLEQPNLADD